VQNFLNVSSLLFSILVGQTCMCFVGEKGCAVPFYSINLTRSLFFVAQITFCIRNRKVSTMHCLTKLRKPNHCWNKWHWYVKDAACIPCV
jgi:hypothetical protein